MIVQRLASRVEKVTLHVYNVVNLLFKDKPLMFMIYVLSDSFLRFNCKEVIMTPTMYLATIAVVVILLIAIFKNSVRPPNFPPGNILYKRTS